MIPHAVMQNLCFITFCKSRKTVEVVLKEARDKLKYDGIVGQDFSSTIAGYRGGYKPQERKEIENKMVSGNLKGLISTNALELGIDKGKIETVIIIGYPGTRASFWQQSGRAGRKGNVAFTVLILANLPFDQYIAINSDWLFLSGIENVVADKNNLFIQLAHEMAQRLIIENGLSVKYSNKLQKRIELFNVGQSTYANMKRKDDIGLLIQYLRRCGHVTKNISGR